MSTQSVNVIYEGRELASNQDVFWRVQIWDEKGKAAGFSQIEKFGTPLFEESDWNGKWIGLGASDEPFSDPDAFTQTTLSPEIGKVEPDARAPMFRKAFKLKKKHQESQSLHCWASGPLRTQPQRPEKLAKKSWRHPGPISAKESSMAATILRRC